MGSLRLFFAAPIPDEVRSAAARIQDELRPQGRQVKWVEPENVHLTLKFLGATEAERVDALAACARAVGGQTAPMELVLAGLGAFPNIRRPRAVWIGLQAGQEPLAELARALEDALAAQCGVFREERRFSGHLTIGRVKSPQPQPELAAALAEGQDLAVGRFRLDAFGLYRSELQRAGPVHTLLHRLALGATPH